MRYLSALFTLVVLTTSLTGVAQAPDTAIWIDVRSVAEFAQGHLDGAANIPWTEIEDGIADLELGKDAPIYLYCGAGGRAELARQWLLRSGYTQVFNAGGLDDARALKTGDAGSDN